MIRFAVLVAFLFLLLGIVRLFRPWFRSWRAKSTGRAFQADLVRDPVCGTWIDRRVALFARRSGEVVPVCSEKCRSLLGSA